MGKRELKVGVVMPTFNQSKFLPAALESYYAQTDGDYDPRLVVVDDGSTDETLKVLTETAEPRAAHVISYRKNRGSAHAINTGVAAHGDRVDALTWISSDNVMTPQWLERVTTTMSEKGAGVVYGGFWFLVEGKRDQYIFRYHEKDRLINDVNCYYGPAFLIRRDVWHLAGRHRGRISHDYDHWLRVEEACWSLNLPIIGVDEPLCLYNAHPLRATVVRAHEFDANHWQAEARKRRAV